MEPSMNNKALYFDESGFTGYNLLDKSQPVFTIASCDLSQEEAREILESAFPGTQAEEIKFSNIWRRKNRSGLIRFGEACRELSDRLFIYQIHKRFAVLTKVVDFLIEPHVHDAGYDFYADGFCWKYTNHIHFGLVQFGDPSLYDEIVQAYHSFSRNPSHEELGRLQYRLRLMANSVGQPIDIFLNQMALGAELFHRYHNVNAFTGTNDLYITTMAATIAHWRQRHDDDFSVIHDDSSHFFRQREVWEAMTGSDVPQQEHRLGDGSTVMFPLRVISTEAQNSAENHSIQFCDVAAGLAAKLCNEDAPEEERSFLNEVLHAGFGNIPFNGIRFQPVFPDQFPPRTLSGPDIVDQMTDIIQGRSGESS